MIADLASHVLDLLHPLVGGYASVMAATQIAYPDRPSADDPKTRVKVEAEDNVVILARTRSGALGTIEATKIATGAEDELRFELHGSTGAIRFNLMDPHHLEIYDATAPGAPQGGRRGWTRIDTGQRYPRPAGKFPSPKASIGWMRSHMAALPISSVASPRTGPPTPGSSRASTSKNSLMPSDVPRARRPGWMWTDSRSAGAAWPTSERDVAQNEQGRDHIQDGWTSLNRPVPVLIATKEMQPMAMPS